MAGGGRTESERNTISECDANLSNHGSDEARGFFEAFHTLLAFLISFLAALIGLHFQVLGVSPLETHFALILLFIIATIVYSIAYAEIKLQPPDADLPIFRGIASFVPTKLSVAL
nr:uncharacterized protein LOC112007220 [Quercus suber]